MNQYDRPMILVVDDESILGTHLCAVLERAGYQAVSLLSGQECFNWFANHGAPDLVIMDINLGDDSLNGPEVIRKIQSEYEVPVVLHSAYTDKKTLEQTRNMAQYGYIHKVPGNSELVIATVDLALKLYRTEKELKHQKVQYQDLSGHLQDLQDNLKTYLAREIHDDLGQSLTALKINLSFLKGHCKNPDCVEILDTMKDILNKTVQKTRQLIEQLRPPEVESTGISEILEWHCRDFSRDFQVQVDFNGLEHEPDIPMDAKLAIYRIVQEALTNGAHHGKAKVLTVEINDLGSSGLMITIEDDGTGLATEETSTNHFGILGMEERARRLGGTIDFSTKPGEGTRVSLQLPNQIQEVAGV